MEFSSLSIGGVSILIYRDDLNHAHVSGNKLHKLAPNIDLAKAKNCSTVLSFGGPYSNHLHALAWAAKESGLASIGIVRGELHADLTPTLKDCRKWGMQLIPSQRKDYREYQRLLSLRAEPCVATELAITGLIGEAETTLVMPEGGSNLLAIDSIGEAYTQVFNAKHCKNISHAICATGTGATLAGLYTAAPKHVTTIGIQAVAEGDATLKRVQNWLDDRPQNLSIEEGHMGGFGKMPTKLVEFIASFEANYDVPLDPVYNGKAMLKISQMIDAGKFKPTDQILFIHTGGLQGKRS